MRRLCQRVFAARLPVIDTGALSSAAIRPQSVLRMALERALRHYDVDASLATFTDLQMLLLQPKFDR